MASNAVYIFSNFSELTLYPPFTSLVTCRSHSPPWSQMGQSSGWLASRNSITPSLMSHTNTNTRISLLTKVIHTLGTFKNVSQIWIICEYLNLYLALRVFSELVRMFHPFMTGIAQAATGWGVHTLLIHQWRPLPLISSSLVSSTTLSV